MNLRFPEHQIDYWASRYSYSRNEELLEQLKPKIAKVGYLTKDDLWTVARWKAPRSAGNVNRNEEDYVREITHFAFNANEERTRIESLTLLDGVRFPSASVILHVFHEDPYPIIDYRALWSLGSAPPAQYSFGFWWEYVLCCRAIAESNMIEMRVLDKALWQYSKEMQ